MTANMIIYGVFIYFFGLVLSAILSLSKKNLKAAQQFFVAANIIGFLTGGFYLLNFSAERLTIANFDWLFHFSPSLTVLGGIFFTLISGVSALVGIYAVRYLELYKETYDPSLTQFLTALFVLGMQGVFFANNPFTFLFFWEVMSITSFFLVMADGTAESSKAAFLYFVMTHLGASAILGGFLILGSGSLTFDLSMISEATRSVSPAMVSLSFVLFLFGFGSKAGLVPFHVWLPEAHPEAPSNISALMSGLMLKVAIYGFITVSFGFTGLGQWAGLLVIALGILSGIVGVLYAVIERDIKRAFAYSSIENMGIIFTMLGVSLYLAAQPGAGKIATFTGAIVAFALFHAISHALFKTALFLSSGVVISRVHSKDLEVMGGLAKLMPIFSFAFLMAMLSSLPIPPFSTFYGEWGFIQNLVNVLRDSSLGAGVLAVLVTVLSFVALIGGLAVFAMVKIFGISMLGLSRSHHLDKREEKTDKLLNFPIFALATGVIVLGAFAQPLIRWIERNTASFATATETVYPMRVPSLALFLVLMALLLFTYFAKKFLVREKSQRLYHTWDCGQPIDETMEYTATAFSAPIRFFFLKFLGSAKFLKSVPVIETNPWIREYSFALQLHSVWQEKLYEPAAKILKVLADRIKLIQSGRIQYYLLLLLATLIATLIIAL